MFDGEAFGEEIVTAVKAYVDRATAPLLARIAELEARAPVPGQDGKDGTDAAPITAEQVAEAVAKHLSANPPPAGADGVGLADALIDRDGCLVITTTAGETKSLGIVVGKDAPPPPAPEPAKAEPTDEERAALAAMFLQKEIGEEPIIDLPAPPQPRQTRSAEPPINVVVTNHIPRKGAERTTVTKHDERGRIIEFERQEIEA